MHTSFPILFSQHSQYVITMLNVYRWTAASPPSDLHVGEEVIRAVESTRAVLDFLAAAAMTEKEKGLSRKLK